MTYIERYQQMIRQLAYRRAWARRDWDTVLAPYTIGRK